MKSFRSIISERCAKTAPERTALIVGIAAGAGTAAYFYVKNHKKEVANAASALASQALALQAKKLSAEQKLWMEAAKQVSRIKNR